MSTTPDLTIYQLIHRGMRNDTARVAAAAATMAQPDHRRAAALARWYDGFLAEFHAHHTVEDTLFFPALAELVPGFDGLLGRIDDEHAALDRALTTLGDAIHALSARPADWAVARREVQLAAVAATAVVVPHLDFEDHEILPLFVRHMPKVQFDELSDQAMRTNGFRGLLFGVPFVMSQCTPAEEQAVWAEAPGALKVLWWATRRGYARRTQLAFGADAATGGIEVAGAAARPVEVA